MSKKNLILSKFPELSNSIDCEISFSNGERWKKYGWDDYWWRPLVKQITNDKMIDLIASRMDKIVFGVLHFDITGKDEYYFSQLPPDSLVAISLQDGELYHYKKIRNNLWLLDGDILTDGDLKYMNIKYTYHTVNLTSN